MKSFSLLETAGNLEVSDRRLCTTPASSVQAPRLSRVCGVKDNEQQQQWQRVQARPKIAPDGNSVSRVPPGGQRQIEKEKYSENAAGAYQQTEQQRNSNQKLDHSDYVAEEDSVRQNDVRQNRTVKAESSAPDVVVKISLKAAVGEGRTHDFIFAKQEEEN
jgi:hypothetical protein